MTRSDYGRRGTGTKRTMASTDRAPSNEAAIGPAGSQSLVVHSDLRCPWARIAVHRLRRAADRRGITGELVVDHRWFPLGDDATPGDPAVLDRELAAIGALEPDLEWETWAELGHDFPSSSRSAAAWVQAAKGVSPAASVTLDAALREALFAQGRPIDDDEELGRIAATVPDLDLDQLRSELGSGRPEAELERQAEVSSTDAVPASPTIVAVDGRAWTNPGVEFEMGDDHVPSIGADDPSVYDDIIDAFLAGKQYD